jgi:protein-S-isoprenylcysteine O-methyltransferase Ste14
MEPTTVSKPSLQIALARSYLVYFVFSAIGLAADTIFSLGAPTAHGQWIALACFIIGPLIIWWAQSTSSVQSELPYFERGPYRFMRNPTQIGILILVMGYTAVSGSIAFLAATAIGYFISDMYFKKYESILHAQYGEQYQEYKKTVPKIL